MSAPFVPQRPINEEIFEAIYNACIERVELMPESQKLLDKRNELLKLIENKVPRKVEGDLSDLYMTIACQFGEEMFKLGLAIGRNPASILDLPDSE